MAKPFDATLNSLIDAHAADWAAYLCAKLGVPATPAEVIDTDLSVTSQADKLFRLAGPPAGLLHLELESTGRRGIPEELLRYNVLARAAAGGLPVHSFLMLLRPKATAADLTGELVLAGADGRPYLSFRYTVIRVWQERAADLLAAGVGLAPLALLTNEAAADLPAAFAQFRRRLQAEALPANIEKGVYGSLFVLCGLRYEPAQVEALYRNLSMILEDSTTYQLILKRGVAQGVAQGASQGALDTSLRLISVLGRKRFGPAPAAAEAALAGIADRERLERVAGRILDAADWDDLLATA